MSPGENLDPLPDAFILQPPAFHPVSSCSNLEPPKSRGASLPAGPGGGRERPSVLGPASPVSAHRLWTVPPELSKVAGQLIPTWV